jgi:hypothetical protein
MIEKYSASVNLAAVQARNAIMAELTSTMTVTVVETYVSSTVFLSLRLYTWGYYIFGSYVSCFLEVAKQTRF